VARIERLAGRFDVQEYGRLDYPPDHYRLLAVRSREVRDDRPWVLITGGVHGYETSGVHGALQFLEQRAAGYPVNLLAVPCVSPWGYERIHRWNANAVDPNRSFKEGGAAGESAALMRLVAPLRGRFLVHIDLHETTDSDESEFRPALAARDGKPFEPGVIPDGFYLVDDSRNPQPEFQRAVIDAVAKVTHIAPADGQNEIIGGVAGRDPVPDARAGAVRGHHRGSLHHHHRGLPRQPAFDARHLQRGPGRRDLRGHRVRAGEVGVGAGPRDPFTSRRNAGAR